MKEQRNIYIAALEENGIRLAEPRRLTVEDANERVWAWTPDSRAVIFTSDRNGPDQIFKQEIDKETPDLITSGPGKLDFARVSPDGKSVLFLSHSGNSVQSTGRLMRAPLEGGEADKIPIPTLADSIQCSRIRSGVCNIGETKGNLSTISLLDPMTGRARQLIQTRVDLGGLSGLDFPSSRGSISPDGRHIAFVVAGIQHNRIRVVGLNGVAEEDINIPEAGYLTTLEWSPEGAAFFCGDVTSLNSSRLLHIQRSGASQVLWSVPGQTQLWGVPSPDGRYLAMFRSVVSANVWMVENP